MPYVSHPPFRSSSLPGPSTSHTRPDALSNKRRRSSDGDETDSERPPKRQTPEPDATVVYVKPPTDFENKFCDHEDAEWVKDWVRVKDGREPKEFRCFEMSQVKSAVQLEDRTLYHHEISAEIEDVYITEITKQQAEARESMQAREEEVLEAEAEVQRARTVLEDAESTLQLKQEIFDEVRGCFDEAGEALQFLDVHLREHKRKLEHLATLTFPV